MLLPRFVFWSEADWVRGCSEQKLGHSGESEQGDEQVRLCLPGLVGSWPECGIWKSMHWFFTILRPFWGKINALKYIVLSYTAAALYNFSCLQKYKCIIMHNYHFWPCTLIYIEINVLISNVNQCTWSKVVIMHKYTLIFL